MRWNWDKYVALYKKQHKIKESLKDHGYSGIDNGTKVCIFLQGIRGTELEEVVNVVCIQPEKYEKDFDPTVSYLGQKVTKKGNNMQSVHIAKTGSQPAKLKESSLEIAVQRTTGAS